MATPEAPRSQIRDIKRHQAVRERGSNAPGVRRGLNSRGIRELRQVNRPPHRYSIPSSMPLTQMGMTIILAAILLLVIIAAVGLLLLR